MWVGGEDKGQVTAASEGGQSISQVLQLPRSPCPWSFPLETAFEMSSASTPGCPLCGVILPAKQTLLLCKDPCVHPLFPTWTFVMANTASGQREGLWTASPECENSAPSKATWHSVLLRQPC